MNAEITGETEDVIGVSVIDDNDVEHLIDIELDGDLKRYKSGVYPASSDDRTTEENIEVSHAIRYAKYYVAKTRGYDTCPWDLNPDRFETVRDALAGLSAEEAETFFGDLLEQSLSHYRDDPDVDTGDLSRPVALPEDMVEDETAVIYQQEVYLDAADEIETVSGLLICYYADAGNRQTIRHGDAPDRDPDARVEVLPVPIVSIEPFRDYLLYNLRCQIRDCYLAMGLEPPEEFRVLGPGQFRFTVNYAVAEYYPEYFDKDADIPGYSYQFSPDLPLGLTDVMTAVSNGRSDQSLYERVRNLLFSRPS